MSTMRFSIFKLGLIIGHLASVSALASDGTGMESWVRTWNQDGGKGKCSVFGMRADGFGHLLVAGDILGTNGLRSHFVVKFGAQVDPIWETLVPIPQGSEMGMAALAVDTEGNAVITGGAGTVKVDTSGEVQWTVSGLKGRDMALDPAGNVVVAGFSDQDLSLAMISPHGSNLWMKLEVGNPRQPSYQGRTEKVMVDTNGDIYVGAWYICTFFPGAHYVSQVRKYTNVGMTEWAVDLENCGVSDTTWFQGMHPRIGGGVVVVSVIRRWADSSGRMVILNLDGSIINNPSPVWATVSAMDVAGNLFGSMGAFAQDTSVLPYRSYTVIRTGCWDLAGGTKWERDFDDDTKTSVPRISNAITYRDGTLVVAGAAFRPESGGDILTLGYNAETGRELWVRRWSGPANGEDEGRALVADEAGNLFVAGTSDNAEVGRDMVLLKYAAMTPVAVDGDDLAVEFPAPVGATVEIQGSTNLVDWLDLGTTQADSEGLARYRDTNVLKTLPQRYYRSRRE